MGNVRIPKKATKIATEWGISDDGEDKVTASLYQNDPWGDPSRRTFYLVRVRWDGMEEKRAAIRHTLQYSGGRAAQAAPDFEEVAAILRTSRNA